MSSSEKGIGRSELVYSKTGRIGTFANNIEMPSHKALRTLFKTSLFANSNSVYIDVEYTIKGFST